MAHTFRQRLDGFVNVLTGLGGRKDKRLAAQFLGDAPLDDATLENLYNNSDLARTVVATYPEEALRQGWEVTIGDDTDGQREAKLTAKYDELEVSSKILDAACWGRLYGGGAIFLGVNQGRPETPLRDEKGGDLQFLTVFDRTELTPATWYTNPLELKFGRPQTYRLTPSGTRGIGAQIFEVHETRLIIFPGAHTTKRQKVANNGWDNSVLQRVFAIIRDFEAGFQGASYLLQDAGQAVYKVKNLLELLASKGGQEAMAKRFEMIELSRSVAHALLVDTEEEFERKTTSFSGVPETIDRLCNRLAAATGIPVSILMGMAPAGLNATGASDIRIFYDRVRSYQNDVIKPAIERITKVILLSQGAEPQNWSIKFRSLYQLTDPETAALRKTVADTDAVYIGQGVVTPEEVAMSRFTPDGWSMETQIDLDLREQLDEAKAANMLSEAANPTPPAAPTEEKQDAFDPDQPRDEEGKWGDGASSGGKLKYALKSAKAKQIAAQIGKKTPHEIELALDEAHEKNEVTGKEAIAILNEAERAHSERQEKAKAEEKAKSEKEMASAKEKREQEKHQAEMAKTAPTPEPPAKITAKNVHEHIEKLEKQSFQDFKKAADSDNSVNIRAKESADVKKQLSSKELESLALYTGEGYKELVKASKEPGSATTSQKKILGNIQSAMAKAEKLAQDKEPATLYRGIAVSDAVLAGFMKSDSVDMPGLSSWSSNMDQAHTFASGGKGTKQNRVLLRVKTKSGLPIEAWSDYPKERESLLSDRKFKISGRTSVQYEAGHGVLVLDVEEH